MADRLLFVLERELTFPACADLFMFIVYCILLNQPGYLVLLAKVVEEL